MKPHAETCGRGPALVLLHGWGVSAPVLAPLARRLAHGRRVILVDLPGYGASPWQPAIVDLPSLAATVSEIVPDGATVLGWSLGGLVALELAGLCDLEALILVACTPRFVAASGWPCGIRGADFEGFRRTLAADAARCLRDFAVLAARGDRLAAQILPVLGAARPAPQTTAMRVGLDILAAADLRASLAGISRPALVVAGTQDRIVPEACARALASELPRGRLHLMPGAAHAPFIGREAALAVAIDAFLTARAPA